MNLSLQFGAMAAPIAEQLADQDLTGNAHLVQHFQRDADAIARLQIRGLLPDSATQNARKRLLKRILSATESRNKG